MAESTPLRKSTRGRVPNKRYTIDAFEGLDILGSEPEAESRQLLNLDDTENDADFNAEAAVGEDDATEESDITGDGKSDGSGIVTPVEEYEDALSYTSETDAANAVKDGKAQGYSRSHPREGLSKEQNRLNPETRSRGIIAPDQYSDRESRLKKLIGTDPKDVLPMVQSREKWAKDFTLPSRVMDRHGRGGMGHPFSYSEDKRQCEASASWDWYYQDGGRALMVEKQSMHPLGVSEAAKYFPRDSKPSHSFLMGPYGKQHKYNLAPGEYMNIAEGCSLPSNGENESVADKEPFPKRHGWMLDTGAKVRCLDWAPNHNGKIQYLAVSMANSLHLVDAKSSAFAPSYSYPACVQIWAFATSIDPEGMGFMDLTKPPKLVHVICTEWGHVKQLKWCPAPRNSRDEDGRERVLVGLLAGVWGDGRVRVLDIQLDKAQSSSTCYVKYERAGFESRPPNTICTCLAWLSATDLAAGCANGFVAIWDIADIIVSSADQRPSALGIPDEDADKQSSYLTTYPYFYQSLHQSYILTMACAYPDHPHFLATSSMDGYVRLTDLRAPATDFVLSPRARHGATSLEYHPALQSFIAPDENDYIRAQPIRLFYCPLSFARTDSAVLSISVGRCHTCILVGSTDGSVMVTNPLPRVLNRKSYQHKQKWFQHEWTRKGQGVSRITEGYKVETLDLFKGRREDKMGKDGVGHTTIYEEEMGIMQVSWNPNLHCGGWAAAGMGSGLIRVEDIAI